MSVVADSLLFSVKI